MWGWLHKMIEWMGDHKLATGAIAATVGYVAVSKSASAAPLTNPLPGSKGASLLPNGGIQSGDGKVVPPPEISNTANTVLQVTTHDEGAAGALRARAKADVDGQGNPISDIVGYWPKDGLVKLLDPGPNGVMVFVEGPGILGQGGDTVTLRAWAAKAFLQPAN